jgi:7,8-dihydropterin-6-yl-methyl-4-(beta-D-ribofuranosyl)aminobenzene 5'-phosphate synthase
LEAPQPLDFAAATAIEVPVVDKLSIGVLVDSTHSLFLRPATVNGVSVQRTPGSAGSPT